jgi:tetratricopeptide (TPR) repeat protein
MFVGRRDEALVLLREALAIARDTGFREMEAEARQFVGMARLDAGEVDGVRDLESALAVATELNTPAALTCYGNLAEMRRYLGALDAAAALHVEGERAAQRFGLPVQVRRFRAGRGCDLYYRGAWDAALAHIDAYLDAVDTGSPHRLAGEVRLHRGRIRLARGDLAGAMADAKAALAFARTTMEPFDLLPALAFHARVAVQSGSAAAEAQADELLAALAGQPFWGAWALPDVLPGIPGEARRAEVRRLMAAARPRTSWYDAVAAAIDGDFARAADIYVAIGSRPDEAYARLHAADRALAGGDRDTARRALDPAIVFFRRVGAAAYLRHAEALDAALAPAGAGAATPAAAPSRRSAR